uniref:(California timema) hypothetical protein n=1 Tax=Timema californicum TaxID=61474 RepID=A0A7R9JD01_TIMCA|nr:unnamed protein product [Timema californicum]
MSPGVSSASVWTGVCSVWVGVSSVRARVTSDQVGASAGGHFLSVLSTAVTAYKGPSTTNITACRARNYAIANALNRVCRSYYTLSLWFPELVTRHEMFFHVPHVMQSAPPNCMLGSSPADLGQHPLLVLPRPNSSDEVQLADDNPCLRDGGNLVYVRMLLVAFSCMPATVWLILHVDLLGRKFFVGKYWALTFVLP